MDLNDLLMQASVPIEATLVMRHAPREPELRRVLPELAANREAVFNAYQQVQVPRVQKQLTRASYLVSCIGRAPGKATFVGLYQVNGYSPITEI